MNAALPARIAIAVGVGLAVAVANDPLAGLVIGFMLAQVLIVYPKYQQMQLATTVARRNSRQARPDSAAQAAQSTMREKLLRYLMTQLFALAIVLFAAAGVIAETVAIAIALPLLAGLTWLQLRILE